MDGTNPINDFEISDCESGEYAELVRRDYTVEVSKGFTQYLIDESGAELQFGEFDVDVVAETLQELGHRGYAVTETEEDFEPPQIYAHPGVFADLKKSLDGYVRLGERDDSSVSDTCEVHGAGCHADPSLPEDTAICIHPKAIVPNVPSATHRRPYLVRHPDGVIVLRRR